jgi:hypothetical protein
MGDIKSLVDGGVRLTGSEAILSLTTKAFTVLGPRDLESMARVVDIP